MLLINESGLIIRDTGNISIRINTEDVAKINIPLVCYGIGYDICPYDNGKFNKEFWDNLQEIINKCALFSVRNQGTLDIFASNNIDTCKIEVVPSASAFIKSNEYKHACLSKPGMKIGINWATDNIEKRYGSVGDAILKFRLIINILNEISQKYNAGIYLIEHNAKDFLNANIKNEMHRIIKEILSDRGNILYEEVLNELFPPYDYTSQFFVDIYRQMDIIVCSREGANIVAFGQNVPSIGAGRHDGMRWTAEHTGMEGLIIDLDRSPGEIYAQAINILENTIKNANEHKRAMSMRYAEFEYIKNAFVDKIIKLM